MSAPATRERGFALPFTIFLIAFLTVLLAAAALRVAGDRRIAEAMGRNSNAFAVAQSGLQTYMGSRTTRPEYDTAKWTALHDGDSMRINVVGGYAIVVARIMQRPADVAGGDTSANETYIVRSTGYHVIPVLGAEPQAARTIAQFAVWQSATIDVRGALAAINGLATGGQNVGAGVKINGTDSCAKLPKTAGLRASTAGGAIGGTSAQIDSQYYSGSASTVATETDINWSKTVGSLTPDFKFTSGFVSGNNNYSVYLFTGDAIIADNTQGTGLLIVMGRLRFRNSLIASGTPVTQGWKGLILVGNDIRFNPASAATQYIIGQAISGLNQLTNNPLTSSGVVVADTLTQGLANLRIKYNSCEVALALASIAGLRPVSNAWVDNWASY
jgi:hypothetical protein